MDDGTEVVAKLPNPNAGAPHFTTASEVATMEFVCIVDFDFRFLYCANCYQMRENLKMPVPKVYAWNSRAQDSTVGAEYIIMEKVAGVLLDHLWADIKFEDRFKIVKSIASYQKSWMSASFKQFGSLYYARDLESCEKVGPLYIDQQGESVTDERFAVGPSTGREFSDDGRASIAFDRGPCKILVPDFLAFKNPKSNNQGTL